MPERLSSQILCLLSKHVLQTCLINLNLPAQVSSFVISLCYLSIVNKFGISAVYLEFAKVCLLAVLVHIWHSWRLSAGL